MLQGPATSPQLLSSKTFARFAGTEFPGWWSSDLASQGHTFPTDAVHKAATAWKGANLSKKPWCNGMNSIQCIKICMNHPRLELSSLIVTVSPCLKSLQCQKRCCCKATCKFEPVCNKSRFSKNVTRHTHTPCMQISHIPVTYILNCVSTAMMQSNTWPFMTDCMAACLQGQ